MLYSLSSWNFLLYLPFNTTLFFVTFSVFSSAHADEKNFERGYTLIKQYRYKEAMPFFSKTLKNKALTDTERADAALLLAFCHYQLADLKTAREIFAKSLSLSPHISYPPIMQKSPMAIQTFNNFKKSILKQNIAKNPNQKKSVSSSLLPLRTTYITILSVGAIALIVGGILGGLAQSNQNEIIAKKNINKPSGEEAFSMREEALPLHYAANGLFVAGGAILLAGGIMLIIVEVNKPKLSAPPAIKQSDKSILFMH